MNIYAPSLSNNFFLKKFPRTSSFATAKDLVLTKDPLRPHPKRTALTIQELARRHRVVYLQNAALHGCFQFDELFKSAQKRQVVSGSSLERTLHQLCENPPVIDHFETQKATKAINLRAIAHLVIQNNGTRSLCSAIPRKLAGEIFTFAYRTLLRDFRPTGDQN